MKKVSSFCALFFMVVTAFTVFSFLTTTPPSWFPDDTTDLVGAKSNDKTTPITGSRKLKENNVNSIRSNEKGGDKVNVEDYNPIDPSPGAAKNINAGPIEHGTPLMPFIPKSPPPSDHPKPGSGEDYN